jgi:hypothetical protein
MSEQDEQDDIAQTPEQIRRAARQESLAQGLAAVLIAAMCLGGAYCIGLCWRMFLWGAGLS